MLEKDKRLMAFRDSVLKQLEVSGFDISKIELDVAQYIDEKHQDCLWYGGQVASVEYKGFEFSLESRGDICATLLDEQGDERCYVQDKNNMGEFCGAMAPYLTDDEALAEARKSGRLVLENNNWFEIFVMKPDGRWDSATYVCNDDNLLECILEMVEDMDATIDEIAKSLDPRADFRILLGLALENYEYVAEVCLKDVFYQKHADAFIYGYQHGVPQIDVDFWVQYEELLGEKMTYEEYVFVDSLYDGDPLELIDVELSEDEQVGFAGLKEALFHLRTDKIDEQGRVGALVAHYTERWTPDNYDTIRDEIAEEHGDMIAAAANAMLEKEYRSWLGVDAALEGAKAKTVEAKKYDQAHEIEI